MRAFCSAKRGTSGSAAHGEALVASPSATPRVPSGQYLAASSTALACSTDETIGTITPSAPVSRAREIWWRCWLGTRTTSGSSAAWQ